MINWSKWHYDTKSDTELTEIAQGIADGKIFTTDHVDKAEVSVIRNIFIATSLLGSPAFNEAITREGIEMFYANYESAGPYTEGKYPVFLACGFLNKLETERVRESIRQFVANRDEEREAERLKNNEAESE